VLRCYGIRKDRTHEDLDGYSHESFIGHSGGDRHCCACAAAGHSADCPQGAVQQEKEGTAGSGSALQQHQERAAVLQAEQGGRNRPR